MCSEDAGVGLDEPFDCLPDARLVSDTIVARSAELNVSAAEPDERRPRRLAALPARRPGQRHRARLDRPRRRPRLRDLGGWQPRQGARRSAVLLSPFVPRTDVLAGRRGARRRVRRPRALRRAGQGAPEVRGRGAWAPTRSAPPGRRPSPTPAREPSRRSRRSSVLDEADRQADPRRGPPGGWGIGVRPQRTPGLASVTLDVPLGDTCSSELELCCDLADRHADGHLTLTRDQNLTLRNVPLDGRGHDPTTPWPSGACPCSARAATPRSGPAPARPCARSASPTRPAPA